MTGLQTTYCAIRREHPEVPARVAMCWARSRIAESEMPEPDGQNVEIDGFDVRAVLRPDDCDILMDDYGRWSDDWRPGAIDHHAAARLSARESSRTRRYFIPEYTESARYADARERGTSRGEARRLARIGVLEDYRRACAIASGDVSAVFVRVEASRNGIVLGSADLGAFADDDEDGIREAIRELVPEALEDARGNLVYLCGCD